MNPETTEDVDRRPAEVLANERSYSLADAFSELIGIHGPLEVRGRSEQVAAGGCRISGSELGLRSRRDALRRELRARAGS